MHRHAITAATGIAGLVIGAAGWALIGPEKTHTVTKTVAATAAPTASTAADAKTSGAHYASAQAIADKLEGAGFVVSMLHKNDTTVVKGMTAYDFTITEKTGPAPGDSGIDMFDTQDHLAAWVPLSKGMGGVAVVGDTWAVSLTTSTPDALALSKKMAPRIAQVLGGTVED
jgi:hypothetical protein